MVKIILIKSPDEWATTKHTCRDGLVVYLSFSPHNIYIIIKKVWAKDVTSMTNSPAIQMHITIQNWCKTTNANLF